MKSSWLNRLKKINGELWLLLSLFVIALILNYMVSMHRVILDFYVLPTLFSAYFFWPAPRDLDGRGEPFRIVLTHLFNPGLFASHEPTTVADSKWFDIALSGRNS